MIVYVPAGVPEVIVDGGALPPPPHPTIASNTPVRTAKANLLRRSDDLGLSTKIMLNINKIALKAAPNHGKRTGCMAAEDRAVVFTAMVMGVLAFAAN